MPLSQLRNVGKVLSAAGLAATLVALPSSTGFSSVIPRRTAATLPVQPPPTASIVGTASEFAKEQAMNAAQLVERWAPFIKEAAKRFNISEEWIRAVMRMESGGRTLSDDAQPITSDKGAMGIMQVMPKTYDDMRQQYGLGKNPYDPHDNVLAGTAYLHWLYDKYGYPKMFAAYNAGPGTLEAQVAGTRKLPAETQAYVKGIGRILGFTSEPEEAPAAAAVPPEPANVIASFTRPDGQQVAIDSATVDATRAPLTNEYIPSVQTVIAMGQKRQGVKEDLATVAAALHRPGLIGSSWPLDGGAPSRIMHVYD